MTSEETRPGGATTPPDDPVMPVHASMTRIVTFGMLGWLAALVVVLLVPALHTDGRSWWPWCCVAGFGLGAIGLLYLKRGRGNAVDA